MTEGSISFSEGRTEGEKRGAGAEETSEKDWRSQGRISIVGFRRKEIGYAKKKERSKSLPEGFAPERENPPEGKVGIAKTFGG